MASVLTLLVVVTLPALYHTSLTVFDAEFCELLKDYRDFKSTFDQYLSHEDGHCLNRNIHEDCASIKDTFPSAESGVFTIEPNDGQGSMEAYCDMVTDGGGWLVLQRRSDGSVDFNRDWFSYRSGFGNITEEFWLGNEIIHRLTSTGTWDVRFDLTGKDGKKGYAMYDGFKMGGMSDFYSFTLSSAQFDGTAGDDFSSLNGSRFSTHDLDMTGCASRSHGAWWFNQKCTSSDLNGEYSSTSTDTGMRWSTFSTDPLMASEIKIRPSS